MTVSKDESLPPPSAGATSSSRQKQWSMLADCVPMLHAYVRRMISDRDIANEVIQEVSLRILVGAGPTEPERFAAWSRGVARHVVARSCRVLRRARAEVTLQEALEEIPGMHGDPEAHIDARAWMSRVLGRIDTEGVELLLRRYVLEETGRELADELDQSPSAVRMRLMRLRTAASACVPQP